MKTKIAIIAAAIALSSSAFAATDNVGSGIVKFEGKVSAQSCTISVDGKGNDATVYLPVVNVDELNDNVAIKATPFSIVLSNCASVSKEDTAKKLKVSWTDADMADATKGYLQNNAAVDVAASNVYLTMYDGVNNGKIIPGADIDGKNNVQAQAVNDSNGATFNYKVAYLTDTASAATAGLIQSQAVYTVSYE